MSVLRLYDRVTGREGTVQEGGLPGRWILLPPNGSVQVNGIEASPPLAIVSGLHSEYASVAHQGEVVFSERLLQAGDPFGNERADAGKGKVRAVQRARQSIDPEEEWIEVLSKAPFDPRLEEEVDPSRLEKKLVEDDGPMRSLEQVCASPREQLDYKEERVPAHKARRLAPRALTDLATRSQDWADVSQRSVRPRRLLALRSVELLDLYENRVAYCLVKRLEKHIKRRLGEVRNLKQNLEDLEEDFGQDGMSRATHRLRSRLSKLLLLHDIGNGGYEILSKYASETVENLSRIRRRLRRLLRSPLMNPAEDQKGVDPNARVPRRLKPTNLFNHDADYHQVGKLWKLFVSEEGKEATEGEHFREQQKFLGDFGVYARWVIGHALRNMGFEPSPEGVFCNETDFFCSRGRIRLQKERGEVLTLNCQYANEPLTFVPVPVRAKPEVQARLRSGLKDEPFRVGLVLPDAKSGTPFHVVSGNPPQYTFCAIGAHDFWSVERVARVIQGWFSHFLFTAYPWKLSGARRVPQKWQGTKNKKEVTLRDYPHGSSEEDFVDSDLIKAFRYFEAARQCPVCLQKSKRFQPRDRNTFWCECASDSCKTEWGLKITSGGVRYATLEPKAPEDWRTTEASSWRISQALGRDLVALPKKIDANGIRFEVPQNEK